MNGLYATHPEGSKENSFSWIANNIKKYFKYTPFPRGGGGILNLDVSKDLGRHDGMQMLVTRKKKKKNVLYYSWPVNLVTDVIVFPSPYHTHTHLSLEKGGWIKKHYSVYREQFAGTIWLIGLLCHKRLENLLPRGDVNTPSLRVPSTRSLQLQVH